MTKSLDERQTRDRLEGKGLPQVRRGGNEKPSRQIHANSFLSISKLVIERKDEAQFMSQASILHLNATVEGLSLNPIIPLHHISRHENKSSKGEKKRRNRPVES